MWANFTVHMRKLYKAFYRIKITITFIQDQRQWLSLKQWIRQVIAKCWVSYVTAVTQVRFEMHISIQKKHEYDICNLIKKHKENKIRINAPSLPYLLSVKDKKNDAKTIRYFSIIRAITLKYSLFR